MDLSSLALALNKSHQPRNSCWRVWPQARGEALAPSRCAGLCRGGPASLATPCGQTQSTKNRDPTRASEVAAVTGAGARGRRASCEKRLFSSGTQMPASKLRPETAQRGVGQDGLTVSASEHRATDGSFTQRAGEEGQARTRAKARVLAPGPRASGTEG